MNYKFYAVVAVSIFMSRPVIAETSKPSISINVTIDQSQDLPQIHSNEGAHVRGVYATITITNISAKPVYYTEVAGDTGAAATNKVELFFHGFRVPYTPDGKAFYLDPSNPRPAGVYSYMGDGPLGPGEATSQRLRVDEVFAMRWPGTYHIVVSRHDLADPSLVVSSNDVDFEVSR